MKVKRSVGCRQVEIRSAIRHEPGRLKGLLEDAFVRDGASVSREKYVVTIASWDLQRAMPIGRPVATIVLSPAEREKLTLIANRSKSSQRDAERARIILGASEGLSNTEIARRERVSLPTVGKWRSRYAKERFDALADAPRSGAPRSIDDKKVEEVLTKTLEGAPRARGHALEQPSDG